MRSEEAESMEAFLRRAAGVLSKIQGTSAGPGTTVSRPRLEVPGAPASAGGSLSVGGTATAQGADAGAAPSSPSQSRADLAGAINRRQDPSAADGPGSLQGSAAGGGVAGTTRPSEMSDN